MLGYKKKPVDKGVKREKATFDTFKATREAARRKKTFCAPIRISTAIARTGS